MFVWSVQAIRERALEGGLFVDRVSGLFEGVRGAQMRAIETAAFAACLSRGVTFEEAIPHLSWATDEWRREAVFWDEERVSPWFSIQVDAAKPDSLKLSVRLVAEDT